MYYCTVLGHQCRFWGFARSNSQHSRSPQQNLRSGRTSAQAAVKGFGPAAPSQILGDKIRMLLTAIIMHVHWLDKLIMHLLVVLVDLK